MRALFKTLKYLIIISLVLVVVVYASLLPKPFMTHVQEPVSSTPKAFSGQLKVISFNLGLLDIRVLGKSVFKPTEFIEERAKHIPHALLQRNADVIALQEIYEKRDIEFFIQKLKQEYPYYFFAHKSLIKLNNGLMVFSKYPFIRTMSESQQEKGPIDEMLIADRGILSTVIKLTDQKRVNLINLHATSGGTLNRQDDDNINLMRTRQLEQALKLALTNNTEYQIILGDFNAGPRFSAINYKYLLENDFTDVYAAYAQQRGITPKPTWTGDNPLNAMRGYTAAEAQLIDHIYISRRLRTDSRIRSARRVFDENIVEVDGKMYPLSDHYGVEVLLQIK
ncbi:MAG: endonuclease/exonuclease/phosphatase family protein [Gammaproteobacteria bacterium]|nr:endonuclease/exonuclease/phosphatase family protein [Gammaproteobacteria bacterium]NNM13679.1 hypothetical protein [Gammaproteobacteria bacterium]